MANWYSRVALAAFVAVSAAACGKHSPTAPSSTTTTPGPKAPTPSGLPEAREGLAIQFVRGCPVTQSLMSTMDLKAPTMIRPLSTVTGDQVKHLTPEGYDVYNTIEGMWSRGLLNQNLVATPACVPNVPATHISLVISAVHGNLDDALQIARAIDPNLWSGSLLYMREYSGGNAPILTGMPFVPGTTDHFTFVDVTVNGRVDLDWKWKPYSMLELIDTVLNGNLMQTFGHRDGIQYHVENNHVVGPMPF